MKRLWVVWCVVLFAAAPNTREERLWQHRNLGKAFYENPTTQAQAVEQFRQALAIEPGSARERLNYGLALLRAGKTGEAVAELLKVQKQEPALPHTWFNLGIVYRKGGDFDKAIGEFERMVELVPDEPVSHYNLGVLYKQAGQLDKAREQFETATRLNPNLAAPHFQLYNVYRQQQKSEQSAAELALFQKLKKQQEGAAIPEDMEWSDYAEIYDPIDIKDGAKPADIPRLRLPAGAKGQLLIDLDGSGNTTRVSWSENGFDPALPGIAVKGIVSAAAGDFDNDGLADLCVLTEQGAALYRNTRGAFSKVDAKLPEARFEKAVWVDYDHDYDLDLILLGPKSMLFRNQGMAGFADHTADFPFADGDAIDGILYRRQPDSKAFDLVVSYRDHAGVLYADNLSGKYEAMPLADLGARAKWLEAEDVNRDGRLDIVTSSGTLLNRPEGYGTGAARSDGSVPGRPAAASKAITVALEGVKNLKLAYGAEVEVKAGASYEKKMYAGVPVAFDLGGRSEADTIRITWPNGLIQNEPRQPVGRTYHYKEAQRLSGSCPMIWTWNGQGFGFITDVLGVAPLGASSGDGQYFATDHDEYIQIPGEAVRAVNGRYEIRITEELSEVSYLDQVALFAVDHAPGVDVFTSERWKAPPFPKFRLYGVKARVYPKAARDDAGRDVLSKLLAPDGQYVDGFKRSADGIARLHTLEMKFPPGPGALLVMNGWVDWADGSTFLGAAQESKDGLIAPYLQVKNRRGEWETAVADMGMPDGKPKTIVVDLTGKFPTAAREIRIVTNMCVYWDEAFLGAEVETPTLTPVPITSAQAGFRGFSRVRIDPERKQPEMFFYEPANGTSNWNPTPGLYTRYGDVKELLDSPDDRFVILGSGDELRMEFEARAPVRGLQRDFILKVDGWAKDRDANTASSQTVEPLPFHAMKSYPYSTGEEYPTDEAHRAYRSKYNTRPALVLIRPLSGVRGN